MKKIKAVIVGYGNRGQVYGDYCIDEPEELEIVGIIDPNPYKLQLGKERYSLNDNQLFNNWNDFLKANISADVVINATRDQDHYKAAMEILNAKYNMLIEKPIVNNKSEILEIQNLAEKNGCMIFVCHVLRYAPFYRTIKELLLKNTIGPIISMELNEHVCIGHYLSSYCKGKWRSEQVCGSPFLLAKCCHDMDLISWLNNSSKPIKVASFGHRKTFIPENKPKDATAYCYNCPHKDTCIYSAMKFYYEHDTMPFLVWDSFNKPYDQISKEEKLEFLKHDVYGQCAYDIDGDIMDRQNVLIDFEDGSVASFDLTGGACRPDRYIHIVGKNGEIEGKVEEKKITVRKYNIDRVWYDQEVIDVAPLEINTAKYGGHGGGDYALMHDLVRYLNGDRSSISMTLVQDSINSHLIVFAAEKSRKESKIIDL